MTCNYSSPPPDPPAAGRERGENEAGDTPAPPAMGLRPPAPPLLDPPVASWERGENEARGHPRSPRPWDCVPRYPLLKSYNDTVTLLTGYQEGMVRETLVYREVIGRPRQLVFAECREIFRGESV